ncbi:hypothetical protein FWC31_02615 [Candidatus Saccharibacteria bacterium]|nr:hypothetical protein [Candidatus Saccharibacteria bacterium]
MEIDKTSIPDYCWGCEDSLECGAMALQMLIRDDHIIAAFLRGGDFLMEAAEQAEQNPERQAAISDMWNCPKVIEYYGSEEDEDEGDGSIRQLMESL